MLERLIPIFLLVFTTVFGCVASKDGQQGTANCPDFYNFDTITRKCVFAGSISVGTTQNVSFLEDTSTVVTLDYINPSGYLAVSCGVINDSPWLFSTGPCLCAAGICNVTLTGMLYTHGNGGFRYKITDTAGVVSDDTVVAVEVIHVNHPPSVFNASFSINDDDGYDPVTNTFPNITTFTLPLGADVDTAPNLLTYSLVPGQTLRGVFNGCLNGTSNRIGCTYTVPESELNGVNEIIQYRAYDGEDYSAPATITFFYPVNNTHNDPPIIRFPNQNRGNIKVGQEITYSFQFGIDYIDAEGDLASTCQIVSAPANIRQISDCTCTIGTGECQVIMRGDIVGAGGFQYKVNNGQDSSNIGTIILNVIPGDPRSPLPISKTYVAAESPNAIPTPIPFVIDNAIADASGGPVFYELEANVASTVGTLSGCVPPGATQGTSLTSLNCVFTPLDGNINGVGSTAFKSFTVIGGNLKFESKFKGLHANNIHVLFEQLDTQLYITGVPIVEVLPYNNAPDTHVLIKIRYRSGITKVGEIMDAVNNHDYASQLVMVTPVSGANIGSHFPPNHDNIDHTLSGGTDSLASFTYRAKNNLGTYLYHATVGIDVTPTNDPPIACAYSRYQGDSALSNVMPTAHACGLEGCVRNQSPQSAGISASESGLRFFDQSTGICYESSGGVWKIIDDETKYIPKVKINEKDKVVLSGVRFFQGGGDELTQSITLNGLSSTDTNLIPMGNIKFFERIIGTTSYSPLTMGATINNAHLKEFKIEIVPVGTLYGMSTISFKLTDSDPNPETTTIKFDVEVNNVSTQHRGWKNLKAIGASTDKFGDVIGVANSCQYSIKKCVDNNGISQDCIGQNRMNVTALDGAIFLETNGNKCYYRDNGDWYQFESFCNISPSVYEENCSPKVSCIGAGIPTIVPSRTESYYYDYQNNECYRSVGTASSNDWRKYQTPSEVILEWEDFYSDAGSDNDDVVLSGHNVYRRAYNQEFDYNMPINKVRIAGSVKRYVDNSVNSRYAPVPGTVYYYEVKPIVNGYPTQSGEAYKTARVIAPFVNTAFIHRDIANKMICGAMLKGTQTDPLNHYRCPYRGPGEVSGGFYDIGRDLIVDRFEMGCNYSSGNQCSGTVDGECIGIDEPEGQVATSLGATNVIYYSRSSGKCYHNYGTGITGWKEINTDDIVASRLAIKTGKERPNVTRLPPLVHIDQARAKQFCKNTTDYVIQDAIFGLNNSYSGINAKRDLPTRKEQIVYSFWGSNYNYNTINALERGMAMNSPLQQGGKCNSSNADGLNGDNNSIGGYTDDDTPTSNHLYSLPGTLSSGIRSMATGVVQTSACESRFGVRDAIGNVAEWVDEALSCNYRNENVDGEASALQYVCDGTSSSFKLLASVADYGSNFNSRGFDNNNLRYSFNRTIGVCHKAPSDLHCEQATNDVGERIFKDKPDGGGWFFLPVGLPMRQDYVTDFPSSAVLTSQSLLEIGPTAGIISNELHEDGYKLNTDLLPASGNAAMSVGGGFKDRNSAGVYHFQLWPQDHKSVEIGFRCKIDIEDSYYFP